MRIGKYNLTAHWPFLSEWLMLLGVILFTTQPNYVPPSGLDAVFVFILETIIVVQSSFSFSKIEAA
jgi:hypothetical protein